MKRNKLAALAAVGLAVTAFSACGDDDDDDAPEDTTVEVEDTESDMTEATTAVTTS